MTRLRALVFDLDGTLYTSKGLAVEIHQVACRAIALQLGITAGEAELRLAAAKRTVTERTGRETTLSAACRELGCDIRELHRYLAAEIVPEPFLQRDERVVAMLSRLAADHRLYIYTNNNRHLAGRIMAAIGVDGPIIRTFAIEETWCSKPDRATLEAVYAAIGARPEECLFVGDRYDVDLRLPAELGSMVFETHTVAELLQLEAYVCGLRTDSPAGSGEHKGGWTT